MTSLEDRFLNAVHDAWASAMQADEHWLAGRVLHARRSLRDAGTHRRRALMIADSSPEIAEAYEINIWALKKLRLDYLGGTGGGFEASADQGP